MRPPVPEAVPSRPRKSSLEQQQWIDPRSVTPSTFFLARNSHPSNGRDASPVESEDPRDSMYGVQSLDGTASITSSVATPLLELDRSSASQPLSVPGCPTDTRPCNDNSEMKFDNASMSEARHSPAPSEPDPVRPSRLDPSLPLSSATSPRPLTPSSFINAEDASSLPSSPKSITNHSTKLDEVSIPDDLSSQALTSGGEDDESRQELNASSDTMSQLIMPSITIPSRRPFTDKGKALGRMKLLLAGASGECTCIDFEKHCLADRRRGSGKSSLIKSIVQICEDIVHIDPFDEPSNSLSLSHSKPLSRSLSRTAHAPLVSEIYASSKPYPTWWSDLEDSRVLRRRKSSGDIVLERNLCFVDTQSSRSSPTGQLDAIIQYINQQLLRATSALDGSNTDFQNMLAGNGGSQVDAILYLISEGL